MANLPPPPAPPKGNAASQAKPNQARSFTVSTGIKPSAQALALYGPGGVGKTELCSLMKLVGINPLFLDLENGTKFLDVARIDDITDWDTLRSAVQSTKDNKDFDAIVIDSFTKAQELASDWVVANVAHEKGPNYKIIKNIEEYGWGKGRSHIYDQCILLLSDLDAAIRSGKHVVLIAHDCVSTVPNPQGEDWIRYEPRLQSPPKGHYSVRHRVKEWCDHMLFVCFDTATKDRKGTGSGTRSIYPHEMPSHWAKSRSLKNVIAYDKGDPELWKQVFKKGN